MKPLSATLALVVCLAAGWGTPARAVVLGSNVDVALVSPGDGLLLEDTVAVGAGDEILPGDGSAIGSVLLSTEAIDLDVDSIEVTLEEGVPGGATGYAAGARLIFDDLYATTTLGIVGVSVLTTNITGIDLSDVTFNARRVVLRLDDVLIGEIQGIDFGTIALGFETAVPEPDLALLVFGGLALLGARRLR